MGYFQTMKKLLIHIGPPKTATTSFQYWLEQNRGYYSYLGVKQPRRKIKSEINDLIFGYFTGHVQLNEIIGYIEQNDFKEILIYSEEGLFIDNWEYKIGKIRDLNDNFKVYVSYCYRDTRKVIPSYFAEIYTIIPQHLRNDFDLFLNDEKVKLYDLNYINEFFNKNKINFNIFNFNQFINSKLNLNSIFSINEDFEVFNTLITLPVKNKRPKKKDNQYLVIDKHPKYPFIFSKYLNWFEYKFKIDLKFLFKKNYTIKVPNHPQVDELYKKNRSFISNYSKNMN